MTEIFFDSVKKFRRVFFYFNHEKSGADVSLDERVRLKKADRSELYTLEPPFPKTNFLMELSNVCNHACIFCAHQKMQRKVSKMNQSTGFRILQEAYDLGTREVGFYATGEPFLVPELPEKIRSVIDAGLDSIKFSINFKYIYLWRQTSFIRDISTY